MMNFDISLIKSFKIGDTKNMQFRWETFDSFNHAQFFGPSSVNGDFDSGLFGQVVKSCSAPSDAARAEVYLLKKL